MLFIQVPVLQEDYLYLAIFWYSLLDSAYILITEGMFLPDVGWKVADHVDIRDDKVVSQQEMAQQVLLLTGVAEQLLTEQAAHVLPSGNPNNDFCQQHDIPPFKDTSQT